MKSELNLRELAVRRDAPDKPDLGPKRHIWTRYVIPLGLLLGFIALVAWAARDLYLPRQSVTVMPVFASRALMQESGTPLFKAAGWIEPRPIPIRVSALAPGVVTDLLVVEDEAVEKGQPVAYLIKEDAELILKRARAALEMRKADLAEALANQTAAETNYRYPVQLEASEAEASAALAKVQTELARLPFEIEQAAADLRFNEQDFQSKKLSGAVVAGIELERAQSKLEAAQARIESLRKQLQYLEQEETAFKARRRALAKMLELTTEEKKAVGESKARVEAARARLDEAKVVVDEAQLRLDRMTITAPVSGRVLHLLAAPGTFVAPGMGASSKTDSSTVVTMYQPDKLQVRVDVRFDDLQRVSAGQPVRIESPALSKPITGKALFISSLADIQKNTLEVKVAIDSPSSLLKPEMLVDATFLAPKQASDESAPTEEQRLFVPRQLVQSDDTGKFVWVADTHANVARKQSVETGRPAAAGLIEVSKGLTLSSRLIVHGREAVTNGSRIHVAGEDTTLGVDVEPVVSEKSNAGH